MCGIVYCFNGMLTFKIVYGDERSMQLEISTQHKIINNGWVRFKKDISYHFMIWPGLLVMLIFSYIPMAGLIIVFQEYNPVMGFHSPFVGLRQFRFLLTDDAFWRAVRNTVCFSMLKFSFNFAVPIFFALCINEVRRSFFKRLTQTISYLPHFLSWVVVCGIFRYWLGSTSEAMINNILIAIGLFDKPVVWLNKPEYFWGIGTTIDVWKSTGFNAILYLAAMAGINPELYEAAKVDGVSRLGMIRHITLPLIMSTIITIVILNIGYFITGANFDISYLLGNSMNLSTSDILGTFVLRYGISLGRYSYATTAGFILSIVNFSMLLLANFIAGRVSDYAIM